MLLVGPLISELERLYPGAEVDIVAAGPAAHAVFSTYPTVRRIVSFHQRIVHHLPMTVAQLFGIRRTVYDVAIDAGGGSQSGRLLLAFVKARYKIGTTDHASEEALRPLHLAQRPVHLLRHAYAGDASGPWPVMDIRLTDDERRKGRDLLAKILGDTGVSSDTLTLAIFANATGRKCYAETWWAQFIQELTDHHSNVRIVEVVAAHAVSQLNSKHATFYSRDLRKMAAVISAADVFLSADCGVMHLAAASGTRTLGLFSVTDQRKYAPYGASNAAIDNREGDPGVAARIVSAHLSGLFQSLSEERH
ncbi:ADP-heptose:LPS heptosyltransferase [Luteibacter rhizovicinus]|uniref:ADP-heptose:LPS heptosyltransferase n=1 Tax=Luteibacter rhizovicinus TaxID=242606 RepID=A0A4R3YM56_9GAMM|nr:ADP-heptose:LPS heptosyltransferase [Luteibacter rhizovicinus]